MNLSVSCQKKIIFTHDGPWLHPLFALEDFLGSSNYDSSQLYLTDKLIGRGAAVLIHRMGIRRCHGSIVSSRGLSYLQKMSVTCTYDRLVEKLDCQTEMILGDDMSTAEAYAELSRRARRS